MNLALIIQLIAGSLGGTMIGGLFPRFDLGALRNTAAGVAGGLAGARVLAELAPVWDLNALDAGLDATTLTVRIASGVAGGALLTAVIGMLRQALSGLAVK